MLAYPLALLMLLGFATSFALFSGSSNVSDDEEPLPEGEELTGSEGDDLLEGGPGNDLIRGGDGNDTLYGGPGNDTLFGEAGDDLLLGGEGDDVLHGGAGNDLLDGGPGNDTLRGGPGENTLLGGEGDDIFVIDRDHEGGGRIDGGPGTDLLDLSEFGRSVTIDQRGPGDFNLRSAGGGGHESVPNTRVDNIEHIRLGRADNWIWLTDNPGDLIIESESRLDRFFLGAGVHTISGGPGNGTYVLTDPTDGTHVDGGAGSDHLALSAHPWFIDPQEDLSGPPLNGLRLTVDENGNGAATWEGNRLTFANIQSFAAYAPGGILDASQTTGGVTLQAAGDGVTLIGGSGDDSFSGGPGSTLTGGEGSDTFYIRHTMFPSETPPAIITDFNPESDRLNIHLESDHDDMDERTMTLRDSDQGLEILIEGHVAVILEGLTTEDEVVPQVF